MDIALIINEYLKEKDILRTEDDSLNIVDNQIYSWNFVNIPCPTAEELEACHIKVTHHNARQLILNEIKQLEEQVTPRRIREAVISGDKSFIEDIEAQIVELRKHI